MTIVELNTEEFDRYVITEPDSNLYHTALWNGFIEHPKSEYKYLAYTDDAQFYYGFALVEIFRKNIFSRYEANIEYGFLTNLYDTDLLNSFTKDLCEYLGQLKVKTLSISPNVLFNTRYGRNEFLVQQFERLGFKKTEDTISYHRDLIEEELEKDADYITVNRLLNSDELSLIEKQYGYSLKETSDYFKEKMITYACVLDIEKSISSIASKLEENTEDETLTDKLERLNTLKQSFGDMAMLEYISYIPYYKSAYILYTDKLNTDLGINRNLWTEVSTDLKKNGFTEFVSSKKFNGSTKQERIGRFRLDI